MGNRSRQGSSSNQSSVKSNTSKQSSSTDSRQYTNIDTRGYTNIDSRKYTNIDSRNMSTNVNNVDNRNISDIALDCGVNPTDVDNYTNDESININQDNSQNIVVTGDGNTLSNIEQKMNLTSYGPTVKKCMQDAVSKMASANTTDLSTKKANQSGTSNTSENSSAASSDNASSATSDNTNDQSSAQTQSNEQSSKQSSDMSQTAGFGSASGGFEAILIVIVCLIVYYSMNSMNSNQFKEVEKFFETMPKLSHTVKVYNPTTKVESDVVLEGLASFFV